MSNVRNNPVVIALVIAVTGMILLAAAVTAAEAGAAEHHDTPLPHLVIQCPISHAGNANDCESFVVSGNPTPGELGESTADRPYLVIACVLIHGNAQDCVKSYTPTGDQIIAPWHR
jgi:hypothetical protein